MSPGSLKAGEFDSLGVANLERAVDVEIKFRHGGALNNAQPKIELVSPGVASGGAKLLPDIEA